MDLTGGRSPNASGRGAAARVEHARRRKPSSRAWLARQLNDPYVIEARRRGLRSRAAFKLIELDRRFALLRPQQRVVDLGCAPGGWTQVATRRVGPCGLVVGVDLAEVRPIAGAKLVRGDLRDVKTAAMIKAALGGPADLVLSDMAPNATGHAATDHLRIIALAEAAFEIALEILAPGGGFVAKVFQGGTEGGLLARLKQAFTRVRHAKPPASRSESAESYVVATGFRGGS